MRQRTDRRAQPFHDRRKASTDRRRRLGRRLKDVVGSSAVVTTAIVGGLTAVSTLHHRPAATSEQVKHRTVAATTGTVAATARAVSNVASSVTSGVTAALSTVSQAVVPDVSGKAYQLISEGARQAFFSTNVPFGSIIYREAKKNDLAPELVAAIVQQESRFKPAARSYRGAQGLMQLVPATGRWMGARNLMDPAQNIQAGAKYLRYLSDRFGGNERNTIAAYNAGEGNVRRFGGLPPFRETKTYVHNVLQYRDEFKQNVSDQIAAAVAVQMPPPTRAVQSGGV